MTAQLHLPRIACLLLSLLFLTSCSRSTEPTPEKLAAQAAQRQLDRAKWRNLTLLGEYERVGLKNPAWDQDATAALDYFASMSPNGEERVKDWGRTARHVEDALANGCNDPLIKYFHFLTAYDPSRHTTNENIKAYAQIGDNMAASSYCDIRKFYASVRSALAIFEIDDKHPEYYRLRHASTAYLAAALEDKTMPPGEAADACMTMFEAALYNTFELDDFYTNTSAPLAKNFSKTFVPYLVSGAYHIQLAWRGRGGGYADSIKEEQWKIFNSEMELAAQQLEKGWKLDPSDSRIPTQMLRVEEGQGKGRERMELWFQRAMKLNPDNYDACKFKLHYLYPHWHGSYPEMIAFGRECMTNEAWGGYVTALLVDAHQAVADYGGEGTNYWNRPEVWEDIHAAFEELFRRNPNLDSSRYNYAWYANACGHPEVVAKQLPYIKEPINYNYFGGRKAFEEMKARALAAAKK